MARAIIMHLERDKMGLGSGVFNDDSDEMVQEDRLSTVRSRN